MPLNDTGERRTFFGDPALDDDLPRVNEAFWASLIAHVERDDPPAPRVILDVGCHRGGLLHALARRFAPAELFGIEPLAGARAAATRLLEGEAGRVTLLEPSRWGEIETGSVDLVTSHEVLYLEPDLEDFMRRVRRVLAPAGVAYVVLGSHAENPLWPAWKSSLVEAGHRVYDHAPLEIMAASSSAGLLPSVQPLRRSGWVTYDPLHADFQYPDVRTMFDHHYRHKLIFRFYIADDTTTAA